MKLKGVIASWPLKQLIRLRFFWCSDLLNFLVDNQILIGIVTSNKKAHSKDIRVIQYRVLIVEPQTVSAEKASSRSSFDGSCDRKYRPV